MQPTLQQKNQHLMWRAGFGPLAEQITQIGSLPTSRLWEQIKKASQKAPDEIDVADNLVKGLVMGIGEVADQMKKPMLDEAQKREFRRQSREDIKSLNLEWIKQMVNSKSQLREKMAFFWHGHFACREVNIFFQQQLLQVIRENALGNFRDLLMEVSKSAAMLSFLNNQQNRKQKPNENFAREVMELFTLGRGNYSEKDIKEAARAFTGWGFNLDGSFVFRTQLHDNGEKTVLGKTGNWKGEDILEILLAQEQTAKFITTKIYRFFISEQIDQRELAVLYKRFYASNYDILDLLDAIFTSSHFYHEAHIGKNIKSPVELIVGIQRMLPMEIENPAVQLILQRALGQLLFNPPNVAGWPGGKNWIDSSTLLLRMRLPQLLSAGERFANQGKVDDDVQMGMQEKTMQQLERQMGGNLIKAVINWSAYAIQFQDLPREKLTVAIHSVVLQRPSKQMRLAQEFADATSREAFIRSLTLHLMALPEYQLC